MINDEFRNRQKLSVLLTMNNNFEIIYSQIHQLFFSDIFTFYFNLIKLIHLKCLENYSILNE